MTRNEFNAIVMKQYKQLYNEWIAWPPTKLVARAWDIAKTRGIRDYLIEQEDSYITPLYKSADTIIADLYNYELEWDDPMWTTCDDLNEIVMSFIEEFNK